MTNITEPQRNQIISDHLWFICSIEDSDAEEPEQEIDIPKLQGDNKRVARDLAPRRRGGLSSNKVLWRQYRSEEARQPDGLLSASAPYG